MAKSRAKAAPAPRMSMADRKWQARDDLRTLQAAADVAKSPGRLKAAQAEAKSQIAALATVSKKGPL